MAISWYLHGIHNCSFHSTCMYDRVKPWKLDIDHAWIHPTNYSTCVAWFCGLQGRTQRRRSCMCRPPPSPHHVSRIPCLNWMRWNNSLTSLTWCHGVVGDDGRAAARCGQRLCCTAAVRHIDWCRSGVEGVGAKAESEAAVEQLASGMGMGLWEEEGQLPIYPK